MKGPITEKERMGTPQQQREYIEDKSSDVINRTNKQESSKLRIYSYSESLASFDDSTDDVESVLENLATSQIVRPTRWENNNTTNHKYS